MNRKLWIALSLAALGATACVDRNAQKQVKATESFVTDPTTHVSVAPIETKTLVSQIEITGSLTTADDAQVGAKQTGKLVSVLVKDGDPVSAGQLIAVQDRTALNAQLLQAIGQLNNARAGYSQAAQNLRFQPSKSSAVVRQAQAAVRSAKANLNKVLAGARPEERQQADANVTAAKENLDTAVKDLQRKQALVTEGALAKNTLDQAQNVYATALQQYNNALQSQLIIKNGSRSEDVQVAREAVRAAQDQLASAVASKQLDATYKDALASALAQEQSAAALVEVARSNLSDADIKAPFSGRISGKPIQAGAVVAPGATIARIIGGQGAYFEGQVPEEQVRFAHIGARVDVEIDALSGRKLVGTVLAVNPLGADVGRLFKVRIGLAGDLKGISSNMFARGRLTVRRIPNAAVVPTGTIVERNGKKFVFSVESNKAHRIPVETGLQVGNDLQILGIDPGTKIVVKGQNSLDEGSPVQVDADAAGAPGTGGTPPTSGG